MNARCCEFWGGACALGSFSLGTVILQIEMSWLIENAVSMLLQTEAPSQFDNKLPPITGEDVEFLREQVPELSPTLRSVHSL